MEPTVENLCGYLTRSHLLNDDEVESLHRRWRNEGADPSTSASQFTRWLVQEKYLTEYQAGLLIKGQINDFFLDEFKYYCNTENKLYQRPVRVYVGV